MDMNNVMPKNTDSVKQSEVVFKWLVNWLKTKRVEKFISTGLIKEQEKDTAKTDKDFMIDGKYIPTLNGNLTKALKKIRIDYDDNGEILKADSVKENRKKELLDKYGVAVEYMGPNGYKSYFTEVDNTATKATANTSKKSKTNSNK